jgi:hypothetical protein
MLDFKISFKKIRNYYLWIFFFFFYNNNYLKNIFLILNQNYKKEFKK